MKTYDRRTTAEKRKSKKGKAAVTKGKREAEVLNLVRKKLESLADKVEVHRMSQFCGGDKRPDINIHVAGNLYDQFIHLETKHDENISLRAAFFQAVKDCKEGTIPVANVKRFREPRIAVLWLDDLLDFVLSWLKEQVNGG